MKIPPHQHQLATRLRSRPRLRPLMSHMLEKGLLAGTLVTGQLLFAPLAYAGPEGGTVVSGQGTITRVNALDTRISQQSQNLLMNFDSFDLSKDETVLINQPNAAAWFVG
ncbi:MAG: large exoprotein involved in heme utilization and adhesion, partial [Sulfitobacter sp.]